MSIAEPLEQPAPPHPHSSETLAPRRGGPNTLDVTVVLPCYNEQAHVMAEIERITAAMEASGFTYELLVIDDKSTDNTLAVLQEALPRYPTMRLMPCNSARMESAWPWCRARKTAHSFLAAFWT